MIKISTKIVVISIAMLTLTVVGCGTSSSSGGGGDSTEFTLSSSDLTSGSEIGSTYVGGVDEGGCGGTNQSPQLSWTNTPTDGVGSLAVTVLDQSSSNFVHWIVYNIPTSVTSLSRGTAAPDGASFGPNDYTDNPSEYGGPCPPTGETHVYQFKVWALTLSDLTADATIDFTDPSSIIEGIDSNDSSSASFTRSFTGP